MQDSSAGYRYGIECLFRLYSYGLEQRFSQELFMDFMDHVHRDYEETGVCYGLEKFWAYMFYRKDKAERPDLDKQIIPEIALLFSTKFKTIDDFRQARQEERK